MSYKITLPHLGEKVSHSEASLPIVLVIYEVIWKLTSGLSSTSQGIPHHFIDNRYGGCIFRGHHQAPKRLDHVVTWHIPEKTHLPKTQYEENDSSTTTTTKKKQNSDEQYNN